MLRPAYLFSSAILAVVAAMQLQPTVQELNHAPAAAVSEQAPSVPVHRLTIQAQTISSQAISASAQPQRWVF